MRSRGPQYTRSIGVLQLYRGWIPRVLGAAAVIVGCSMLAARVYAQRAQPVTTPLADWVIVTDDRAFQGFNGCDRILLVDVNTGAHLAEGEYHPSPAQVASTADGSMIIGIDSNGGMNVMILRPLVSNPSSWVSTVIEDKRRPYMRSQGSAPAFAENDTMILMPLSKGVEKYAVANVTQNTLGPVLGTFASGGEPADIEVSSDTHTAYIVGTDGFVYTIDVPSMTAAAPAIPYDPVDRDESFRTRRTFATLSPDGRYLVVNAGERAAVNIIDLVSRESRLVPIPQLDASWGIRFNHAPGNHGLLAIHGEDEVGVFEFRAMESPRLLAVINVPPHSLSMLHNCHGGDGGDRVFRFSSLAWTARGDGLIAAIGPPGRKEFRILDYQAQPQPSLRLRLDFDACEVNDDRPCLMGLDVLTLNAQIWRPTPTPSPIATATLSATSTAAATRTPTASPTFTVTASPTVTTSSTPTPLPSPTPTSTPAPLYLPLALREHCIPDQRRIDVVLVIDASSSMQDPTSTGRPKIAAALEAARTFLDQLQPDRGDQAAIVAFSASAELLQPLTTDHAALASALARIQIAPQTCLVCGVEAANAELAGPRHRPDHAATMIVLTDGRSNPRPAGEAVERAAAAKARGVVVFTIGLGNDLDAEALATMASRPAFAYRAPDAEDLADIYRAIAVAIPCPAGAFWGGR